MPVPFVAKIVTVITVSIIMFTMMMGWREEDYSVSVINAFRSGLFDVRVRVEPSLKLGPLPVAPLNQEHRLVVAADDDLMIAAEIQNLVHRHQRAFGFGRVLVALVVHRDCVRRMLAKQTMKIFRRLKVGGAEELPQATIGDEGLPILAIERFHLTDILEDRPEHDAIFSQRGEPVRKPPDLLKRSRFIDDEQYLFTGERSALHRPNSAAHRKPGDGSVRLAVFQRQLYRDDAAFDELAVAIDAFERPEIHIAALEVFAHQRIGQPAQILLHRGHDGREFFRGLDFASLHRRRFDRDHAFGEHAEFPGAAFKRAVGDLAYGFAWVACSAARWPQYACSLSWRGNLRLAEAP